MCVSCLLATGVGTPVWATRYAGDFEELGVSARSVGMGSASVAVGADLAGLYYNPSATALLEGRSLMLMHAENFGGQVRNDFAALAMPSAASCIGFGLLHNGVAGIKLTELKNPNLPIGSEFVDTTVSPEGDTAIDTIINVPVVTKTVQAADWVVYFNYARPLGRHFLLGGNLKVIYRTTGVSTCYGMGLDLGATAVLVRDFNLGLRVRNLTTSALFWDTKTPSSRELMLPRPVMGLSKGFNVGKEDRLLVAIEAEGNLEGLPLEENLGIEYRFRKALFGRLGFHRGNFTFGLGGQYQQYFVDYGYETASYAESRDLPPSWKLAGGIRF